MDSFEFEVDGYKFRVSSNDGHAYTCIEEFRDGKWKYLSDHTFVTTHAFRALLANRAELVARAQLAAEDAEKWLPIESAPKDGTCVLVYYLNGSGKGRRAHAQYIPRFTEESYEDFAEYCEEKDVYYTPEGWYEICESWDDYSRMKLIYEPTHWRHLPPPPAAQEGWAR